MLEFVSVLRYVKKLRREVKDLKRHVRILTACVVKAEKERRKNEGSLQQKVGKYLNGLQRHS